MYGDASGLCDHSDVDLATLDGLSHPLVPPHVQRFALQLAASWQAEPAGVAATQVGTYGGAHCCDATTSQDGRHRTQPVQGRPDGMDLDRLADGAMLQTRRLHTNPHMFTRAGDDGKGNR
ncbi:hypothetical protein IM543_01300 [Massilia sp. UMI-21]|nr:hypothetical protein IM543_01300 [Massilia sp. UMI-21]